MQGRFSKCTSLILASLAVLPSIANAEPSGWYVGVSLGTTSYGNSSDDERNLVSDLSQQGITATANVDDSATGWTLGAGYAFNPYFALEGEYIDLGTAHATANTTAPITATISEAASAKGETLNLVGIWPLNDKFNFFGKFGLFNYTLNDDLTASFPVNGVSANGTTYDVGIGAGLSLTQQVSLRAGLTHFHGVGDENTTGKANLGMAYLQLVFSFH